MATLHLLANPDAAASCLAALAENDALLALGDGVYALDEVAAQTTAARVGVLSEDARARGVSPSGVRELSYAEFVAWVVECERSVTWC